jgi:hypothetical protein
MEHFFRLFLTFRDLDKTKDEGYTLINEHEIRAVFFIHQRAESRILIPSHQKQFKGFQTDDLIESTIP